jgi:hypothetical protein
MAVMKAQDMAPVAWEAMEASALRGGEGALVLGVEVEGGRRGVGG